MAPKDDSYTSKCIDGVRVVSFNQSQILDAVAIDRLSANLKEHIDSSPEKQYVLFFGAVSYLSSSALGMLIGLQRRFAQRGGDVKLAGIHDEIMEVFRITKLDTVFDIYKDVQSAVEAHRKNL